MDEEKTLIGMWLTGQHLEDLNSIIAEDFTLSGLVKGLKDGKQMYELSRENKVPIAELAEMTTLANETFYKIAMTSYLNGRVLREVKAATKVEDLELVKELLENTRRYETVRADSEIAEEYIKDLDARQNRKAVTWSGYLPSLNNMTGGIRRGELTAIAARPSVGKSAFALQIGLYVQGRGHKVLYFPLEMSRVQTCDRILLHTLSREGLTGEHLKTGAVPGKLLAYGTDMLYEMEKSKKFMFYEGVSEIERIEAAITAEKPFLVIIDQLTQMKSAKKFNSTREKFSYMTSTLKALAMKHNIAIILLCQVNRGADSVMPTMANLKESGSIEEDSDNVILLHRYVPEQLNNPGQFDWQVERPMNLNLAKQRAGEVGDFNLVFTPSQFRFTERI